MLRGKYFSSQFSVFIFQSYSCFEANIDFEIRFMVDTEMTGCGWIEVPPNTYRLRDTSFGSGGHDETRSQSMANHRNGPSNRSLAAQTRCQIELDVAYDALQMHNSDGKWSHVAPVRILSFDIECAARKGNVSLILNQVLLDCGI